MVAPLIAVAAQVAKRKLIRRVVRVLLLVAPLLIAGLACVGLLLVMLFTSGQVNNAADLGGNGCVSVVPASQTSIAGLDREQLVNAQTIVAVGRQAKVPAYGWVVAVATAMQESGLRNLDHGDLDSLGLFQQRAGWGSDSQRMDAATAARMFYTGGKNAARSSADPRVGVDAPDAGGAGGPTQRLPRCVCEMATARRAGGRRPERAVGRMHGRCRVRRRWIARGSACLPPR